MREQKPTKPTSRPILRPSLRSLLALLSLLGELGFPAAPAIHKDNVSIRSNASGRRGWGILSLLVFWGNALPVGQVSVSLGGLGTKVGQMAGEKEVVLRRDGERVAHEGGGVDDQGAGHRAGDTVKTVVSISVLVNGEAGTKLMARFRANGSGNLGRTFQDPSVCPSQPQWGYRSWRQGPRSL